MSLIAHGHIELNQLPDGIKVSNRGLVVKDNASTWEVVVPDGQGTGFNEQTWGELTRKYMRPITDLSQENFAKIVEETVCYVKSKRNLPLSAPRMTTRPLISSIFIDRYVNRC